jgi:hypothetical protein
MKMTELQLLSEDLKRLYRNLRRVQSVDNFVYDELYQVLERYSAVYFMCYNGYRSDVKEARQQMAQDINGLLNAVKAHYGDKLADLEITEL